MTTGADTVASPADADAHGADCSSSVDGGHAVLATPSAAPLAAERPPLAAQLAAPEAHAPPHGLGLPLVVLAAFATIFMMHWARAVLIPLMLGLLLSYALAPVVNRLQGWRVPRGLASAAVVSALLAGLVGIGYGLSDQTAQLIDGLPQAAQKLRDLVRRQHWPSGTPIDKVQKAAQQFELAANESAPATPASSGVTRVQIEKPGFVLRDYLMTLTPGLMATSAQATVVVFISHFLLASGNRFRLKLVRLAGPSLTRKKITVKTLDDIGAQIQRYLLVQALISVAVGVVTGLAFWWMGMAQPAAWGLLAACLNLVPYIGALVFGAASAMAALLQFGSIDSALLVLGVSTALHFASGHGLMPWLTGRANRMHPLAVFIGLMAFGWLWGMWGLLLGVPILLIVKTVCEHVPDYRAVGEILGA